jgi:hypothetical protein
MAIISKFVRGSATVDLNDGNDGFQLGGRGWLPAVATPVYMGYSPPVVETLHLRLRQTSHNNVSTYMQAQVFADQYINDPTEDTPVWLHAKLDNETGERRALVRSIQVQYGASWYGDEATVLDVPLTITVTREPYWESTTARDLPASAALSGAAVVYDYTASGASVGAHDIVGDDVGARIEILSVLGVTTDDNVNKAWMGIRSDAKADTTHFNPIWECEDGVLAAAVATADIITEVNTASPGGGSRAYVVGTPTADNTWEQYLEIRIADLSLGSPSYSDSFIGTFLWLLRSKVATSSTYEVRLRHGVSGMYTYVNSRIAEVDHTSWNYTEMSVVSIPPWDIHGLTAWNDVGGANENKLLYLCDVSVWAKRTSGTADIYFDCLCPIPVDEGFLHFGRATDASDTYYVSFFDSPQHTQSMLVIDTSNDYARSTPSFNSRNFVLPPGNGRLYCVYSGSDDSDITDEFIFNSADNGKYYERWLSLRGSE